MSDHYEEAFDQATGEIKAGKPNGISARLSSAAAQAHVQSFAMRNGVGAAGLHFALWQATQELPIWITTDKQGARSKYATLKHILEVVRPVFAKHGIRIRQGCDRSFGVDEGAGVKARFVPVYTDFIHVPSGEMERTTVEIPVSKLDPQAMGSAISYGKRYSLLAGAGLATDEADDDGAGAMPLDLSAKRSDSNDLLALKADIDACKDIGALTKWATEPKNRKRIDQLGEAEADRLREHYSNKREKMSSAE